MARLTLLGGLRIEDEDGPLPGRASQRRRLALLALLASPPGHPVPRDKLIAFLWPDVGDERARRNLSSALYDLRAELGDDVVSASGDELALDPEQIPSDVAAFTAALEAGDLDAATAVYAGPFLDGFFLADAVEFERWSEGERQRYAGAYRKALEQLADRHRATGDHKSAVDAWRKLSVADPYNSRVALGYMHALEAVGDRAGALQFARVHTALLREEFGAAADPEVTALAERLRDLPIASRSASAHPLGGEPVPPPTATPPPPSGAAAVSTREAAVTGQSPARTRRWKAVVLVVALVGVAAVAGIVITRPATIVADNGLVGLAVLPFKNLSGFDDMDFFSQGLTEEIISGLGRVPSLRIPSRTTVVSYQDREITARDAGRELGVRYLLEGAVRREDARLRITARLIDAQTDSQIWHDQYDLRLVSVFDAQERIAQAVVGAVAPQVSDGGRPLVDPTTRDTAAYALYLKGRAHWYGRTPGDLEAALAYFERAIEQDSTYALAFAAVADVHNVVGAYDYSLIAPERAFPAARRAAEQALRLNPDLPEALAALSTVLFNFDWDLGAAEVGYRRAIALNPGYGMARHWLSLLLAAAGRPEEALVEIYKARENDPRSAVLSTSLARHHYFRRDFGRALDAFDDAVALDSSLLPAHMGKGVTLVAMGEYDRGLSEYRRVIALLGSPSPLILALVGHAEGLAGRDAAARAIQHQLVGLRESGAYVPAHGLAIVALGLGDREAAMHWLEESARERSAAMVYATIDPLIDPLRDDPRFALLMRRITPAQR